MRTADYKKRYPGLWKCVEESVLEDIKMVNDSVSKKTPIIQPVLAKRIAFNAAAYACFDLHEALLAKGKK